MRTKNCPSLCTLSGWTGTNTNTNRFFPNRIETKNVSGIFWVRFRLFVFTRFLWLGISMEIPAFLPSIQGPLMPSIQQKKFTKVARKKLIKNKTKKLWPRILLGFTAALLTYNLHLLSYTQISCIWHWPSPTTTETSALLAPPPVSGGPSPSRRCCSLLCSTVAAANRPPLHPRPSIRRLRFRRRRSRCVRPHGTDRHSHSWCCQPLTTTVSSSSRTSVPCAKSSVQIPPAVYVLLLVLPICLFLRCLLLPMFLCFYVFSVFPLFFTSPVQFFWMSFCVCFFAEWCVTVLLPIRLRADRN